MRRKFIEERASAFNAIGAGKGAPFVVSAGSATLPQVETASFGCKHCNTVFATAKGMEPFCVNCGSDQVEAVAAAAQSVPATDAGVNCIVCSHCQAHNVMSDVTASAMDGRIHCVECGGEIHYDADDLDKPITDAPEADIDNAVPANAGNISPADRGGMTRNDPIQDADAQSVDENMPIEMASEDPPQNAVPTPPANGEAEVYDVEDETLVETAGEDQDIDWEQLDPEEQNACEYSKVSLAAVVLSGNPKGKLSLASSENEILAFVGDVPVARLEKSGVSEDVGKVFHSAGFLRSISLSAEQSGVRKALAAFNFKPIHVEFPVKAAVRARVKSLVESQVAVVEKAASTYRDDLTQSLSLAATALNRNLFRSQTNPLKAAMTQALTRAGVENARAVTEQVFAAHGDEYNRSLLALAADLQSKPVEYRNTLAQSMGDINPVVDDMEMPNGDTQEVVVETAALQARMERGVRPATKVTSTTAGQPSTISKLRAAAGGSLF